MDEGAKAMAQVTLPEHAQMPPLSILPSLRQTIIGWGRWRKSRFEKFQI